MNEWIAKALALGATIDHGINWTWANSFPTREAAEQFCQTPGMETRGIYPDDNGKTFSVRFR